MKNLAPPDLQNQIGRRVRFLREARGWTQAELSKRLGFKDRQTLSAIESGQRRIAADELVTLMEVFEQDIEFFTDPTLLVGEGAVSWRAEHAEPNLLDAQEPRIRRLVGLYRHLTLAAGESFPALIHQLPLDRRSSFEDAMAAGERVVREWDLGSIPARRLREACEKRLEMLVLYLDLPMGISGAALRLPELGSVVINRKDPSGRKNFDFAHELFHLLTWQTLPPERIDDGRGAGSKQKRTEQLANTFASALLMPEGAVRAAWEKRGQFADLHEWYDRVAHSFQVSAVALYFRLKNLGIDVSEVLQDQLTGLGFRESEEEERPYSPRFVELLHRAMEQGSYSARRLATDIDCSLEDLKTLFQAYGLTPPFDL